MLNSFFESLGQFFATSGVKLICSIFLLLICWHLIGVLIKLLRKNSRFSKIDQGAQGFILACISIILKVVLVLTVAANLGVPMTNIVAVVGSCGLAVGLALQGSLSNFAGGIMLLIFHPFRVGDYIEAEGKEGTVKEINLLSSRLTTPDNKDIIIPNGTLMNSVITNYSAETTRRVDLEFSVALGTDTERIKKVLLLLAEQHELVLSDPAPIARMSRQDPSALVFTLRVWCNRGDYWTVRYDLLEQTKEAFEKLQICVPYPQMDVHVHQ
ncbi:MAG: mechanosensitive ion channel family protein [Ruminococcaceae bacterium]|nr:mechanosensitive ion channel family protein [Oscillospiraceae bacterium]